jgi:WD40 repeat protein
VIGRIATALFVIVLLPAGSVGQSVKLEKSLTVPGETPAIMAAISPKGDFIAGACKDGRIRLWTYPGGELRQVFDLQDQRISALSFSMDGSLLAGGGDRGGVKIWTVSSGKQKLAFSVGPAVRFLAFSPDRKLLAVARHELPAQLWDLDVGRVITDLPGKFSGSEALAFSPDGQRLASADGDTEIRIYEAQTGALRATNSDILLESFAIAFSPDSKSLYVGGADKTITALDPQTGKIERAFPKQTFVVGDMRVSRDGRLLCAVHFDDKSFRNPAPVLIWDVVAATVRTTVLQPDFSPNGGEFLPDGRLMLTTSATGRLQVWSVR